MKYLMALLVGILCGGAAMIAGLYYNPFVGQPTVSAISVSENDLMGLAYSVVPNESLVFTNDGESIVRAYPERVQELWEPTIKNSHSMVALLTNRVGEPVGIGVKISSLSEDTRLLNSELLVDSVWHIHIPGRGALFMDQTENYWSLIRDIAIPARWSSSDNWRGAWHDVMTVGPNALGTARVSGASGEFTDLETEAIESLSARAFSANDGPIAMSGSLTVSLPAAVATE